MENQYHDLLDSGDEAPGLSYNSGLPSILSLNSLPIQLLPPHPIQPPLLNPPSPLSANVLPQTRHPANPATANSPPNGAPDIFLNVDSFDRLSPPTLFGFTSPPHLSLHTSEPADMRITKLNDIPGNQSTRDDNTVLYLGALMHVLENEPKAFSTLQADAGIALCINETDAFLKLVSALHSSKVQKKTKEKVEKCFSNYVVHGFVYHYSAYSPAVAEKAVLTATDGKDRRNLMKQWALNTSEWAKEHKQAYGNIIDARKNAFRGIISEEVYKRINHLKTAHLSTFYKKIKSEAQEQLTYWAMLDKYPQFDD